MRVSHSDRSGTGLVAWDPLDPAGLVSGSPVQRGAFCDEVPEIGYSAGVWDCTAFVDQPGPYPVDEFMLLVEGTVVMALPDGTEVTIGPGEAFVIPKGLQCQWKMPDYVRKVFMIVDDPVPVEPDNPSLRRITVPDLMASGEDGPIETRRTWFTNATGQMTVAVCTSKGERSAPAVATANELVHVLDGDLLLHADGVEIQLRPGETAYLKAGALVARQTSPGTRWIVARYAAA